MASFLNSSNDFIFIIIILLLSTVGSSLPFTVSNVVIGTGKAFPPEVKIQDNYAFFGDYYDNKEKKYSNVGSLVNTIFSDQDILPAPNSRESSVWNEIKTLSDSEKDIKTPSHNKVELKNDNGFQPYYGYEDDTFTDTDIENKIDPGIIYDEYESAFTNVYEDVNDETNQEKQNFSDIDDIPQTDDQTEYFSNYHTSYDGWLPYFREKDQHNSNNESDKQEDEFEHSSEREISSYNENKNPSQYEGMDLWNNYASQETSSKKTFAPQKNIKPEIKPNGWIPYYGDSEIDYSEDYNMNKVEPEIITLQSLEDYLRSEGIFNIIVKSMLMIENEEMP